MEATGMSKENMLKPLHPFKQEADSNSIHVVCVCL